MQLETREHLTGPAPAGSVIWLHGLGADAGDFEPVVPMVAPGADCPVRFVFPDAPRRPVTLNGGAVMRAWYDLTTLTRDGREDADGMRAMAGALGALIDRERARGVPPERVVLAGFSQGGAMALFTALAHPARLAGIVGLSCYLPDAVPRPAAANARQQVLLAHGEGDPVLPASAGRAARDALRAAGHDVEWHAYAMGHTVIPEELAAVRAFIARVMSGESAGRHPEARD